MASIVDIDGTSEARSRKIRVRLQPRPQALNDSRVLGNREYWE